MDLESLPRFPAESQERPREKDEHLPTWGESQGQRTSNPIEGKHFGEETGVVSTP